MEKDQEKEDRDLIRKCTVNLSIFKRLLNLIFLLESCHRKKKILYSFQLKGLITFLSNCKNVKACFLFKLKVCASVSVLYRININKKASLFLLLGMRKERVSIFLTELV